MKNLAYTLKSVPPYVLFLAGFASVVSISLIKLHSLLQSVI